MEITPVRLFAPVFTALALFVPTAADAATVHVGPAPSPHFPLYNFSQYWASDTAVYYVAAAGERNHVTVKATRDQARVVEITVHDEGAHVEPGDGCVRVDDRTARCSGDLHVVDVQLGDGDDELHEDVPRGLLGVVRAFAGAGDDLLVGGAGWDELDGGGGHDRIFGGAGGDIINDGDLTHAAGAAGPGPDVMDGGAEHNLISYEQRTARVVVDLGSRAPAGERGEGDTIRGFDAAIGGSGGDRLTGTKRENELYGRRGNDVLLGLADGDWLHGGAGRDRLSAGEGNDTLWPGTGTDSLTCGAGGDGVYWPAVGELMGTCEAIIFDHLGGGSELNYMDMSPHPATTSRTAVKFLIGCPEYEADNHMARPCAGTLTLRARSGSHALLGRAQAAEDRGTPYVRVKLTAAGRRLIRRRRGVVTDVLLRGAPSAGHPLPDVGWTIRLRA